MKRVLVRRKCRCVSPSLADWRAPRCHCPFHVTCLRVYSFFSGNVQGTIPETVEGNAGARTDMPLRYIKDLVPLRSPTDPDTRVRIPPGPPYGHAAGGSLSVTGGRLGRSLGANNVRVRQQVELERDKFFVRPALLEHHADDAPLKQIRRLHLVADRPRFVVGTCLAIRGAQCEDFRV